MTTTGATVYPYVTPDGATAYTVIRKGGKEFLTEGDASTRYPFFLPRLIQTAERGGYSFVVEGEKDATNLLNAIDADDWRDITATTSSHGASYEWGAEFCAHFRGLQGVYVIADNDEIGRKAAEQRARALAAIVPCVTLLACVPGVAEHGDVSDYLANGNDLAALVRWCDGAPQVTPSAERHAHGQTLRALLANTDAPHDWLVPGLIERGERIVITGDEGYGKSTLLRQLAIAAALGANSLADDPYAQHAPRTVLLIDLENSEAQIRREVRKTLRAVPGDSYEAVIDRVVIHIETSGYVLDDRADKEGDRERVQAELEAVKPDLLLMGPLYKMQGGDPNEEKSARELARWLDLIRGKYGCALIIEAHAPHNQLRPYGWSGWKRWPEIGMHLAQNGALTHWRGAREERAWPAQLARASRSQGWLWKPSDGTARPTTDSADTAIADCGLAVARAIRTARRPLTRVELIERVGRRKSYIVAAIARLVDSGALVPSGLAIVNERGERRTVQAFTLRDETPDNSEPFPISDPIGPERGNGPEMGELLPFPEPEHRAGYNGSNNEEEE